MLILYHLRMNRNSILKPLAFFCRMSGLNAALRPLYGGAGVALMFHRFTDDASARVNMGGVVDIGFFDALLAHIRNRGIDIIALKDAPEALKQGRAFVCLTFDDGYRDNLTLALPILEEYDAPATIFVPSSVLDGSIDAWWLQIEHLADTPAHYAEMAGRAMRSSTALAEMRASFAADQRKLGELYFMNAAEVKEIAAHNLIDIGGHTRTHPRLSSLSEEEALAEIAGNKLDLEKLLGHEIECFAYPYGNALSCGVREYDLAQQAGYKVAVTTREANLRSTDNMMALPRYGVRGTMEDPSMFDMMWSGVYGAIKACA